MKSRFVAVLAGAVCLPVLAFAAGMNMGADSEAAKAFADANDRMMKDMMVMPTGDADRDFVLLMMPHHQGAIDMAKIELQYGKDPEILQLAEGVVAAQESEIAAMKAWLAARPQ